MSTRDPTHAGSWYAADPAELKRQLDGHLATVTPIPQLHFSPPEPTCRAIIGPHAGYSYSGRTAAWAYASIPTTKISRVFILGPSHHHYLNKVAVSRFEKYETPLGDLELDGEAIDSLLSTNIFDTMSSRIDEEEHSIEMHLPFIRHVFGSGLSKSIKIVPLLVGSVNQSSMLKYAEVLSPYWKDEGTFWVISSDFCHWGTRFSHTPYYPTLPSNIHPPVPPSTLSPASRSPAAVRPITLSRGKEWEEKGRPKIWESIEAMDHEALGVLVEAGKEGCERGFRAYLDRTENTICGRNPILLLLTMLEHETKLNPGMKVETKFIRYEQSSKCLTLRDSSVSYVSGVICVS